MEQFINEIEEFQFTPLREGRQHPMNPLCAEPDFNSRPSARGDKQLCKAYNLDSISIHAPPRGAT